MSKSWSIIIIIIGYQRIPFWESKSWSIIIIIIGYQRMMVDPMFMIIHNFRLFLIAVTPTVVAQTAVILRRNLG